MRTAAGHRLFPLYWLTAMTGMRRNEVLGLRWPDIDFKRKRLHLNRGLVAVGYEGPPDPWQDQDCTADHHPRRHDPRRSSPGGGRSRPPSSQRSASRTWTGGFTDGNGDPVHPYAVYEAFRWVVHNAGIPAIRFHDLS
jgi:integrase